ncbi:DNA repair and recombination RAD54B [Chlorella sorokiniana]|uniref:DNA repair and recombination RAD54B n=1 Tax=Chlorella sorokiniana TaxID=3076 RepID=A0A2P6TUU5_CHLSO|nr:DNA repair and recombination RAD54B [Chlorella sorokiniana]|eukprot:PRW57845.1 DNA repair and recombination RAD54B [Chlorella sorokiniana]
MCCNQAADACNQAADIACISLHQAAGGVAELRLGKRRPAFKPPAFVKKPALPGAGDGKPAAPPRPTGVPPRPAAAAAPARPAAPAPKAAAAAVAAAATAAQAPAADAAEARYFTVLYCKFQPTKKLRKNKSFADGVLEVAVDSKKAVLMDAEGKVVSSTLLRGVNVPTMGEGSTVVVGNWEVEVQEPMDADKYKSGEAFMKPTITAAATAALAAAPVASHAAFRPVAGGAFRRPGGTGGGGAAAAAAAGGAPAEAPRALHDPHAEGAIILNEQQWAGGAGRLANGRPCCPVVVDPYIGRNLRPHQVEGVRFLYEATMGLRTPGMQGCILADEMGLGKTLQVISLLWTLLKQGPEGKPAVRKAMVVTPSSLTQNWADEFRKWLGIERLRCMVLSPGADGKQQVVDFKHGSVHRVLITSYETLRKHSAELAGTVDLLTCDEGHRLKSAAGNKTISSLLALNCPRRILLTGTPIQNDLTEFFAMVNFVNPDSLGSLQTFERVLAAPINRSRDRNATDKEKELGATRSAELARRVEKFVLRRTREVNSRYLPPLSNYVVFCRPTELQLRLYSGVLGSGVVRKMLSATGSDFGDTALSVLTNLRKLCNHPALYRGTDGEDGSGAEGGEEAEAFDPDQSGKMAVLGVLLHESIAVAGDRVVVVSQSTAALDLVQKLCDARSWATARIDGGTDVNKRQDVVNAFNSYGVGQVFLLSTTAGGAGLNLVGANRLVLLDSHWNPALDLQAMARVWRDGQKKACVVYRLLTTGTLDEKMYQRQLKKGDIAATMMGGGAGGAGAGAKQGGGKFSKEELKQLFTLNTATSCDTADILQQAAGRAAAAAAAAGRRAGAGSGAAAGAADEDPAVAAAKAAAAEFRDVSASCTDAPLQAAMAAGHVSFVHQDKNQAVATAATGGKDAAHEPEGQQQQQPAAADEGAAAAQEELGGGSQPGFGEGSSDLELEEEEEC